MRKAWVGVDTGKTHHWAVLLDADGGVLLSQRVANDRTRQGCAARSMAWS